MGTHLLFLKQKNGKGCWFDAHVKYVLT